MRHLKINELADLLKTGLKADEAVRFKARLNISKDQRSKSLIQHTGDVSLTARENNNYTLGLGLGDRTIMPFTQSGEVKAYSCEERQHIFELKPMPEIIIPVNIGYDAEIHLDQIAEIYY